MGNSPTPNKKEPLKSPPRLGLKSGFKRTIIWNIYRSNPKTYAQNQYRKHLVDPSFQEVMRLFVYLLNICTTSHSEYYRPKVEIKDYNVKIVGRNFFHQPIDNDSETYENNEKNHYWSRG